MVLYRDDFGLVLVVNDDVIRANGAALSKYPTALAVKAFQPRCA